MTATLTTFTLVLERLAHELGHDWRYAPSEEGGTWLGAFVGPREMRLAVALDSSFAPKRITIRGEFPQDCTREDTYDVAHKPITVDCQRPAREMARDIQRRLMPAYRHALGVALDRRAQRQERERRIARGTTEALARLREVLDAKELERLHRGDVAYTAFDTCLFTTCGDMEPYCKLRARTEMRRGVEPQFTLTIDHADVGVVAAVIALLHDLVDGERQQRLADVPA